MCIPRSNVHIHCVRIALNETTTTKTQPTEIHNIIRREIFNETCEYLPTTHRVMCVLLCEHNTLHTDQVFYINFYHL